MGELGFMGLVVPSEYGGAGTDTISYAVVIEELARACASTALGVAAHNSLACGPINLMGSEARSAASSRNWRAAKRSAPFA